MQRRSAHRRTQSASNGVMLHTILPCALQDPESGDVGALATAILSPLELNLRFCSRFSVHEAHLHETLEGEAVVIRTPCRTDAFTCQAWGQWHEKNAAQKLPSTEMSGLPASSILIDSSLSIAPELVSRSKAMHLLTPAPTLPSPATDAKCPPCNTMLAMEESTNTGDAHANNSQETNKNDGHRGASRYSTSS